VTGICLLILRCFFPGCTLLARLNAAHLLRPKGTLGQAQTILFSQWALAPFAALLPPLSRGGGRNPRLPRPRARLPRARRKPRPRRGAASGSWRCRRRAPGWVRFRRLRRRRRLHRRRRRRRHHLHFEGLVRQSRDGFDHKGVDVTDGVLGNQRCTLAVRGLPGLIPGNEGSMSRMTVLSSEETISSPDMDWLWVKVAKR
jgi:hypothetical protein